MEPTNVVNELSVVAIKLLAATLAALAAIYLPRLFKAAESRLKIDIPDPLEAEAARLADRALDRAEEWSQKKLKELSAKVPSNDKLDTAAAYFRDHARDPVIKWLGDKVEDYIEERLGARRRTEGPAPVWVNGDPA